MGAINKQGNIEESPALRVPKKKRVKANLPATGSKVHTISKTVTTGLPSWNMAPQVTAIIALLIIKTKKAAIIASFFCCPPFSFKFQPFPFTNNGLDKNVAEAIVVPTKAATIILPPFTSGTLGISPSKASLGSG